MHNATDEFIWFVHVVSLETELEVINNGIDAFDFTVALHTYFQVPDVKDVKIQVQQRSTLILMKSKQKRTVHQLLTH